MRSLISTTFGLCAAFAFCINANAQTSSQNDVSDAKLSISISGIDDIQGVIAVGIYKKDGYEDDRILDGKNIEVDASTVLAEFSGLEPGKYAIQLFHDINGNGTLDTNLVGIPSEPYAFSNNADGTFGPASWDDAKFSVGQSETTQTIILE